MHILIIEGNTAQARAKYASASGKEPSQHYADVLRFLKPDSSVDIIYPADGLPNLARRLEDYDGAIITGSALNIEKKEPEAMRQVELAQHVYTARVPFFGSCWGLQVATVAAGGEVHRNPKGREVGIARKIERTAEGLSHPLLTGRGQSYDALAIHSDIVSSVPSGMIVLSSNSNTPVQAAEIRFEGGVFWGVQYHPEFTFDELASIIGRLEQGLVEEGFFENISELHHYATAFRKLDQVDCNGIAWLYGIERELQDPYLRRLELSNWLQYQVLPFIAQKS